MEERENPPPERPAGQNQDVARIRPFGRAKITFVHFIGCLFVTFDATGGWIRSRPFQGNWL
jgi:hypothetical protein